MKQDVKQRWIEALRSGKYAQAQHKLRTDDGYCCLGVLCDLHSQATGQQWVRDNWGAYPYLENDARLPFEVVEWAGLEHASPPPFTLPALDGYQPGIVMPNKDFIFLSVLNDTGTSFEKIADMIEEQL